MFLSGAQVVSQIISAQVTKSRLLKENPDLRLESDLYPEEEMNDDDDAS